MDKRKLNDALHLFKEERAALRAGQLSRVTEIADQKEQIIQDLAAMRLTEKEAAAVRDATVKSAQLLKAALDGVQIAQRRLSALRKVRDGLSIYTSKGARQTVRSAPSALERKA